MAVQRTVNRIFNPRWLVTGIVIGLSLQLIGWLTGVGLIGGLPSYLIMGIVVGWMSPGNTIIEPGAAAFVVAALGFVLDHLLLSLLGVGLVFGVGYGFLGLVLGMAGGWIGERLDDTL